MFMSPTNQLCCSASAAPLPLPAAGGKMKDWDKQESEDDGGAPADQLEGMGGSSDDE